MASLRLDDQLCFGLYSASRAVTSLYRVVLEDLDLTYPQYLVMLALWDRDHRLVKELGAELNLDSGTLSPLLKRLQTAGLVVRNRQADDERSVRVSLTESGKALHEKARGVPDVIGAAMGLDEAGLARMRAELDRLTESVNAYREALSPA
ncbi:MarR family transcriptional regulator [Amycolatopsis mediterranei S699]|uniref:MarR family transcriptional regulator n=2 Tax=Amycolatopsis mediterranei TaxID=33910 RepID=A0A0H3CV10_AMYMU|nr:MarR family transcriptional regulator [Amycolatopsis mediterranei]ADJ42138.1 MarR family transcriptional regulator [Amycolatopsis mediterranei U32]AEK38814.1 MarR family transcriptional regulator [Amycolatopsis mediterranei S699]AFO73846.1 MarR family transcriptional regulator [Amycolatopsis mediterranei S699]AGT80975.1 MarR family transcriptional regulator [Amycolatopsis mediterranei RB]KDO08971.1 MarR family transcriptional regulator [Amycolatopsis mediterranei]